MNARSTRRFFWLVAGLAWFVVGARAAVPIETPAPADMRPFATKATALFNPESITSPTSELNTTCENVLLLFQAISATLIVAALVNKLRREHTQMEGVASTLMKVAFIATIPFWRSFCLDTVNSAASSIGYQSVAANGTASPVMNDLWGLMTQWVPPGSPYLDVTEAQNGADAPASGSEQDWGMRAWNWARGVGEANASIFHSMWQVASGSLRALLVFGSCALMVCCLSLTVMAAYLGEILRYLLFYGGCAMLPVFIAGLGIDTLRAQSVKAILSLIGIALWPIGWALANIVTHVVAGGIQSWMSSVATHALVAAGMPEAPFAIAAPYLAWGILFLFVGMTVALCLWMVVSVFYVPVLMTRALGAGVGMVCGFVEPPPASVTVLASSNPMGTLVRTPVNTTTGLTPAVAAARRVSPIVHVPEGIPDAASWTGGRSRMPRTVASMASPGSRIRGGRPEWN